MKKAGLVAGITASATVIANLGVLVEAVAVQRVPALADAPQGTISSIVVAVATAALAWIREVAFGPRSE